MATDRIGKLEQRVEKLEEKLNSSEKEQIENYYELTNLIKQAVEEAVKPLLEKLEKQEKRISELENADANKALEKNKEVWKTVRSVIISVIITFFATLILNNLIAIANDNTKISNENEVKDVSK